jgi:hypothetical protein
VYFNDHTQASNFEARLYENDPNKRFDIIFGTIQPGSDQLYVSGVQGPNNALPRLLLCWSAQPRINSGAINVDTLSGVSALPHIIQ